MSLFPIFKVNKLTDKDQIDTIYVFCGQQFSNNDETEDDLNDLFDDNPTNKLFSNIFDQIELSEIQKQRIDVKFIKQSLHIDDNIGTIKLKIFEAIEKEASLNELYLFCLVKEKLNPITVYQSLTQNDKIALTKVRFQQITNNLYDEDGNQINIQIEDKTKFTFDDILKLDLQNRDYYVGKSLGQKFVFETEYPIIANPFLVEEFDPLLERSRRELTTLNGNLLLENGPIFKNTIYLCLAKDVYELADINDLSTEYSAKIYFPFLFREGVDDADELEKKRDKLIESTEAMLTNSVQRNFKNVDLFYDVFETKKQSDKFSLNSRITGVTYVKATMYPDFKIKIPIDVIFKLIHATNVFPLIKYNPETRQENIYRLFAPELTKDGKKIPHLPKATIFKLMRTIGKNRSVAVYTNIEYGGKTYYMSCEFEENGNITVYPLIDFEQPILLVQGENMFANIDEIISLAVNPLIEQIKGFFEQSGLEIPLFKSLSHINVEIRDLKFKTVYNITKSMDINKFIGCISSVFTVESGDFKRGIQMRYKRVSNFSKLDSQEAFIIEKVDQGYKIDEIVAALLENYPELDEETATELIVKIRTELEVIRGANKKRLLMIKINPGFKTTFTANLITSELAIEVSGINNIYYLSVLSVYLDTIVRINQDINSSEVDASKIKELCSQEEVEDIEFGEITAQSEKSIEDNMVPSFSGESAVYEEDLEKEGENMDQLLDLLGYDSEEEEDLAGGQNDSESGEVSSEEIESEELSKSSKSNQSSMSELKGDIEGLSDLGSLGSLGSLPAEDESVKSEKLSESVKESPVEESSLESESIKSKSVKSESVEEPAVKLSDLPLESESVEEPAVKLSDLPLESELVEEPAVKLSDLSLESESVKETPVESKSIKESPLKSESIKEPAVKETPSESVSVKSESVKETPLESISVKSESVKEPSVESESIKESPLKSESTKEPAVKLSDLPLESVSVKSESVKETPLESISVKSESVKEPSVKKLFEEPIKEESEPTSEEIIIPTKQKKKREKPKQAAPIIENTVRDITGMKLQYPNPFSARLEERMPQLFVKTKDEKFDAYTRMCPFSLSDRRQPIILTKEEKDKILQEHPDDLDEKADFIEYGADPNDSSKKYYYTCPRYWCLLTNTMVTEQDILDGKCGPKVSKVEDAIIPKKEKTVPKGKYVYQFYEPGEKKYPGFHKQKTPAGLCIPCCYSNWSTKEMKNRRDICQGKFDKSKQEKVSKDEEIVEEKIQREMAEVENYVKGPEKYGPQLGEYRWGFLPIALQKFLHEVNDDCRASQTSMSLKFNHTCILRHGVENSGTQSFIACIASAVFFGQKDETAPAVNKVKPPLLNKYIPGVKYDVPSIKEMKEIIINALTIDNFIKYQNGDLVNSFADPDRDVDIENYKSSKLYKKIKRDDDVNQKFIRKIAQSFENFKDFLKDNKITIDYTYLWDLVSMPNPGLFEAGVNLIILEIPEDDTTNNIELICPSNHYSINTYDARRRSLLLVKRENYFEPIYGYNNDGKNVRVTKTFSEYDKGLPKTLRAVFAKIIKPTLKDKCKSLVSKPNEYRFKQAPLLDNLIKELVDDGYTIDTQVLNFQGKVIGVLATNKDDMQGFIPCYPSSLTNLRKSKKICDIENQTCSYDFTYMNDDIWKSYEDTLSFLKIYYDYEEPSDSTKVNCWNPKYFCRVAEEELITGFLTNTNQFIPIKDPVPISSVDDSIKTITQGDTLAADIEVQTGSEIDSKRVEFIKRIKLETNYFNVFRNTIRILFNDYSNSEKRKVIQDECNRRYVLYRNQLDTVIDMLHDLVGESIVFVKKSEGYDYSNVDENAVQTCISSAKDKCEKKGYVCRITNDKCSLLIPKENLVNGSDNETHYYGRMADELIRYNRIKSFVFKPQIYLSFGQVKYNLRDDEIIVLQDMLNAEFFEDLIPAYINKYAKYNTYDGAEPIVSQTYEKAIDLDDIINPNHERDCNKGQPESITSGYWHKCFPGSYKEVLYTGSNYCSLYMMIDLIEEIKNKKLTVEEIKDILVEQYSLLTEKFRNQDRIDKIIDILREEAQFDANQLQDNTINFEQMIMQDGFVAINFDLWLLLNHFKIPSILISSKQIPETRYNAKEFVCYTEDNTEEYVFILAPAMYRRLGNKIPEYKVIIDEKGKSNIKLTNIKDKREECLKNIENAIDSYYTIEDYLDFLYEKDNTTNYKKRQAGIRNVDLDYEIVEETVKPEKKKKEKPQIDFDIIQEEEQQETLPEEKEEEFEIAPVQKKKVKKLKQRIILEEEKKQEEERQEEAPIVEEKEISMEIVPVIKRKKNKTKLLRVNPPGKRKTKRAPVDLDIVNEL